MTAPNALWAALFTIVVALAEYFWGQEIVATYGATIAAVLSVVLRMWQERQAGEMQAMARPAYGYWWRVLIG